MPSIDFVNLTSGGNFSSISSQLTASITPLPNKLIMVHVGTKRSSSGVNVPSITGCGLSFTQMQTQPSGDNQNRLSTFYALSLNPTPGQLTIDFGGQLQNAVSWVVDMISPVSVEGDAVVQSNDQANATVTSLNLSLPGPLSSADNYVYGALFVHDGVVAITPGSGFTEIVEAVGGFPLQTEYKQNQDFAAWTFPSSTVIGTAAEIKFALELPPGGFIY